jgi:Ni,Fe-hydrogenase maturation factor
MSCTLLKDKAKGLCRNTLIVGVGNRLLGDEGVGLHAVDHLLQIPMPPCIDIAKAGAF